MIIRGRVRRRLIGLAGFCLIATLMWFRFFVPTPAERHELAAAALDRIAPNMIFTNVPIEHVLRRVSDSVDVRLRIDWDSIWQPGIERNHANHALDRPLQVEQCDLERHQAGSRTSKSLQRLIVQLAETRVSIASITQTLADR